MWSPVHELHREILGNRLIAVATTAKFTTTTTAAARTFLTRAGNVDGQGTTAKVLAIQAVNGFLRLFRRAHGHKSEAARAVGGAIHHQVGFSDAAKRREGVLQVIFGSVEGKVSNE